MSASNGGLPSENTSTIFTVSYTRFPHVEDDKINTNDFLEASKSVVNIVGM